MVDRMRQALAWALAGGMLWMGTLAAPIMGLSYWLTAVSLDAIGYLARRFGARWRGP